MKKQIPLLLTTLVLAVVLTTSGTAHAAPAALTLPATNILVTDGAASTASASSSTDRAIASADGMRVAVESDAPNLTSDTDTNGTSDVFLYDANIGTFTLISKNNAGTDTGNGASQITGISDDGTKIIFYSLATDLTAESDTNSTFDVFLYDALTDTVTLVSEAVGGGTTGDGSTNGARISGDGSTIALSSFATDLTTDTDTNTTADAFAYDVDTGTITLISESTAGNATGNLNSSMSSISADGSLIAITSSATDLTADTDGNGGNDVFLYDVDLGTLTLVSEGPVADNAANNASTAALISADGGTVAFASTATDLTADTDTNNRYDIFLYDVGTTDVTLVTQNSGNTNTANHDSFPRTISADGSLVAFESRASNLTTDTHPNPSEDNVFVYDADTDTMTLVSFAAGTTQAGDGPSDSAPYISPDGSFIYYRSEASDLTADTDTNGEYDVYRYDVQAGTNTLLSTNAAGTGTTNGVAIFGDASDDGSLVYFTSSGTDLVTDVVDVNQSDDLFVLDTNADTVSLISQGDYPAGSGNGDSTEPSISADGRFVAFESSATSLTPDTDLNNADDVFLYDALTDTITLVSFNSSGTAAGNARSFNPIISADGSAVIFESSASNLTSDTDTNDTTDIFLYDVGSGTLTLVSQNEAGTDAGDNSSIGPDISGDGSTVVFVSDATDLTPDTDTTGVADIFLYDVGSGALTLVSQNEAGTDAGDGPSFGPDISGDGSAVVFRSRASDLTTDTDTNGTSYDIYLYDVGTQTTTLVTESTAGNATGDDGSNEAVISDDGTLIAVLSDASDLTADMDTNGTDDIYLYDVTNDTMTLVSQNVGGTNTGNNNGRDISIAGNGSAVVFESFASDLVTTDTNSNLDTFVYDVAGDTLSLVSTNATGTDGGNGGSEHAVISADGSTIVYESAATDITDDTDTNSFYELFAYDVDSGTNTLITTNAAGTDTSDGFVRRASVSANGDIIAFEGSSSDLVEPALPTSAIDNVYMFVPNPTTPTDLTAAYDGANDESDLSWTDTATETGYTLERSTDGGTTWTVLDDTLAADTTSYSDTSVVCGSTYTYRIIATNAVGESGPSSEAEVSTPVCPVDGDPSGVSAFYFAAPHEVGVTWTDEATNEDGYIIERKKDAADDWYEVGTVGADVTGYTDDTVTCDQDYVYRVTATNAEGDGTPVESNVINTECNIFSDVPAEGQPPLFEAWIEDFYQAGITEGCNSDEASVDLEFCPTTAVNRGQMAVFILRALAYPDAYTPMGTDPNPFDDVPSPNLPPVFELWIEDFLSLGITTGCNPEGNLFCPEVAVDRGQMAVFILRALDITPVDDPSNPFIDVPSPNQPPAFEAAIETFYNEGITTGCNNGVEGETLQYCPEVTVDRGQMALFILRAFDSIPDPDDP